MIVIKSKETQLQTALELAQQTDRQIVALNHILRRVGIPMLHTQALRDIQNELARKIALTVEGAYK